MFDGLLDVRLLDDFGSRFCFDHLSHGQNPVACRRVVEAREIGEKFVQNIGGLLIGNLHPSLVCKYLNSGVEQCGKRMAMGDGAAEPPQVQVSKRGA